MLDWLGYRNEILGRIGALSSAKTGHLNGKTRELIALAVAVATRCDGGITVHSRAALEEGATTEEIAEAFGVAVAVNAGAALVYSGRVLDAVDSYRGKEP